MGDPLFKTVDSQAEKAQIFEKVKEIRDKFYKFNPNLKICISDQQIKKNIDLKYDYYKKCKNYYDFRKENEKYNTKYLHDNIPGYKSPLRSEEKSFISKSQIENMAQNLNTTTKRNYIHDKGISRVINQNFIEVFDCLFDADKAIDYALKHQPEVSCGATFCQLVSDNNYLIDPNVKNLLTENRKIFESPFCAITRRNQCGSILASFLYSEKTPNFSASEKADIIDATLKVFPPRNGADEVNEVAFIFSNLDTFKNEKEDVIISEALKNQNIENVLHYKPANPNETIVESLINGHNLVERPKEEIKFIDEEFSKYEIPMLKEINDNPLADKKLSGADKNKYLNWKKTHNDEDAYKRINDDLKNNSLENENAKNGIVPGKDLFGVKLNGEKNIVNEEDYEKNEFLNNKVEDPLSDGLTDEQREKEQLFKEAVKMRDTINSTSRGVLISTTDEQIRKNIDKKFTIYKFTNDFNKTGIENKAFNENYFKEHGIPVNKILRGADSSSIGKDFIDDYVKETNTPIKAAHYSAKEFEKLTKVNVQEVLDAIEKPSELMSFVSRNETTVRLGFTVHAALDNARFSKGIEKQIVPNEFFYQTLFEELNTKIQSYASPLSMLSEGIHPEGSEKHREDIMDAISENIAKTGNVFFEKNLTEPNFLSQVVNYAGTESELDTKKIREALKFTDNKGHTQIITDISKYAAVDKNLSFEQALFDKKGIRLKTDKELKELQDEFNLYDVSYVKEKLKDPEHSSPLSRYDEEINNNIIKTNGKDPYEERMKKFDYTKNYFNLYNRMSKHLLTERDNQILGYVNLKKQYDDKNFWEKIKAFFLQGLCETGRLKQRVNDQKKLLENSIKLKDEEVTLFEDVKDAVENKKPNIEYTMVKHVLPETNLKITETNKDEDKKVVEQKKVVEIAKDENNSSKELYQQSQLEQQNTLDLNNEMSENNHEFPSKN